jgi:pre-60S factor REI1
MKRRVANLPPVNAAAFNEKVLERRAETAIMASPKATSCDVCGYVLCDYFTFFPAKCYFALCRKSYSNENSYRSHLQSKKHKENELKAALKPSDGPDVSDVAKKLQDTPTAPEPASDIPKALQNLSISEKKAEEEEQDEDIEAAIDAKISAARSRLSPTSCLFCSVTSPSIASNLTHMASVHSFFIPDAEYLISVSGLIAYLGEKVAVGNYCIYCNGEFRSLAAVRNHMLDKSHCKIAYSTEKQRLELSDFYDFSSSYPDYDPSKVSSKSGEDEEGWEDVDEDDMDVDEVVDEEASDDEDDSDGSVDTDDTEDLPDNVLAYGDNEHQLVLPSGVRIGHRSQRKLYAGPPGSGPRPTDPNSKKALAKKLLTDKTSDLVPVKGSYGAFGAGTQVVKARNRGEAREAGRHIREFRDIKRKEDYKTRVAYVNNYQKHYRDPILGT